MKKLLLLLLIVSCTEANIEPAPVDGGPVPGLNFYMLKQVDFDGTTEFHPAFRTDEWNLAGGRILEDSTLGDVDTPITLVFQRAKHIAERQVLVEYQTETEEKSDYVAILWSVNPLEGWEEVGRIPSKNEPTYYSFIHAPRD